MKIDPKHDYKKPLYAIGVATLIGATALFGTACGPKDSTGRTKSNIDSKPSETEVELAGEETIARASDRSFLPFSLLVPSSERVFTCINSFSPPGQ